MSMLLMLSMYFIGRIVAGDNRLRVPQSVPRRCSSLRGVGSGVSRVGRVTAQGDVCHFGELRLGHDLAISSDAEV